MSETSTRKRKNPTTAEEEHTTSYLIQYLEKRDSLYELHTHLLGMGNASFWIQSILMDDTKLPTQQKFEIDEQLRIQFAPLVWDKKRRGFVDPKEVRIYFNKLCDRYDENPSEYEGKVPFCDWISDEFKREKEHHELSFSGNFAYDVVFCLKKLSKGFGLDENQPRDIIQGMIEEKLGVHTYSDSKKRNIFDCWIIFNARKQKLQVAYGILAEDLRSLIGSEKPIDQVTDLAQRDARAHVINAFSMMNADGSEPHSTDFHSFRGSFTPEFYARRFALKDSIYEQRLDLLAYLLKHVLRRYAICLPPVKYCEFSIGCGDISRPWTFDVLTTFSQVRTNSGTFKVLVDQDYFPWLKDTEPLHQVEYRFLVGFNRRISENGVPYSGDKGIKTLFEIPHRAIHILLKEIYLSERKQSSIIFAEHVKQLSELQKSIETNKEFYRWVVGLDSCGDELGHPYCPFVAHKFIDFVIEARIHNENFGVRIHAAENVPFVRPDLHGYRLFAAHMYILYLSIHFLKQKLKFHIRIGHGIAFDKLLSIENHKWRKSSVLIAEIQRNAKSLFSSIPFEINITSNFYLLGDAIRNVEKSRPLSHLYEIDIPVVLSTDNDGIWPIDNCSLYHQSHHSLGAEYCRAIVSRFITKSDQIDNMIRCSKRFCFDKTKKLIEELDKSKEEEGNSDDIHFLPVDIIPHPDVLTTLYKYGRSSDSAKMKCLNFYKLIYGLGKEENETISACEEYQFQSISQIFVACFYLLHSLTYEEFDEEFKILYPASTRGNSQSHVSVHRANSETIFKACEVIYSQLMNDAPRKMQV